MFYTHIVSIGERVLFEGRAESVLLPGVSGEFEIAELHGPIAALLTAGAVTVRTDEAQMRQGAPADAELSKDAQGRWYRTLAIEQGVMRFDGKELHILVE